MNKVVRRLTEVELEKKMIQDLRREDLMEHYRKLEHSVERYSSYDPLYSKILNYLRDRLFA